jgi:hypothetical protein
MRKLTFWMIVPLACGCALETPQREDDAASRAEAVRIVNALDPNGIAPNGIAPNGIAPNGIAPNALTPTAMSESARSSLRQEGLAGKLSRMFIEYAVSCAFTGGQTFEYTWNDGSAHAVSFNGAMGLAPDWQTRGLTATERRWVSACMAARTNYFGVSVTISLRGSHGALSAGAAEIDDYRHKEGAFWGDIFADTPTMKACYFTSEVAYARSLSRVCATLTDAGDGCGILESIGPCDAPPASCTASAENFDDCGGATEVITVFLH